MPRYRITSPEGRSVVVEGNQPPTEQDIAAIFGNMPQQGQPKQDNYSPLQKAIYTGRAAGEGLAFGLGDLAAGTTNVLANDVAQATHGQGVMDKLEGAGKFAQHILQPWTYLQDANWKKGRRDFVREQNAFAEEHPWLNFGGELGGGLVTGVAGAGKKLAQTAGKQGLKAIIGEGAREGAKFGMAYGAGTGLTQNENNLSVSDALKGGAVGLASGAALGAAIPAAAGGIGRILSRGPVENAQNVALKRLVAQNPELVQKSINEGTPLINIADKKLFRTTRGAVSTNPEAEQILTDYAKKFNAGKSEKVEGLINKQLGEKSSIGAVEDILEEGRRVYKPIYDKVMQAGDLQIPIKNQRVLNAFSEVLKDYPELDKLPATDIRVLDLVKQKLDDKIGVALRQGENNKARMLLAAKNELVGQIDAKVPQYVEARKAFKAMKDLEDLVSKGQQVKQLGREELGQLYEKTAPEERGAIKAGIRDVLIRDLDRINSEGANSVKKVFSNSMLGKLQRIGLGDENIVKAIEAENLANSNIQGVFGGSNTAQKIADILNNTQGETSLGRAIFQPARTAKRYGIKAVDYLVNKIQNSSPAETAKLMTDPAYLKSEYNRIYGKVADIAKGGNKHNGSGISSIVNKLKEEGGFAMKPLEGGVKKSLEYANEPFAKNPESIKNFQKWSDNAPFISTNEEALKDPFKTGKKVVVKAYHGTQRADRVGNVFRPDRATSGPMPMFSSSEEVAKGYMRNKSDTSIRANEDISYENWFRIKNKGKEVKLDEAWYKLSPKQREIIAQNAPHIRQDDQALNIIYDKDNFSGLGGYREHLREANGNHLKALVDEWLNSGSLYDEGQFVEVLKKAGLKEGQFVYDNPNEIKGDVFNTYIQFKKPLVTSDIPKNVISKLEEVAKKQPIPETQYGVDLWDKNTRHPIEWIKSLKEDYKNGKNSFAWSSIPDWVTNVLKDFGYDGIIDRGGKGGGAELHRVYIPFKSNQIKSVNNRGTFSKKSPNIYKSLIGGLGVSQILKNKENK